MDSLSAVERLAALGHETRLAIFRLLVQAGPAGFAAGEIVKRLHLAPATASFHLAHLVRVGLIAGLQQGRFIIYSADFAAIDDLIAYLTENCCASSGKCDESCLPKTARVGSTSLRRRKATT